MQIILTQDVKNIGKKGDVKNVSDGYARNFLLAKKLAEKATLETIEKLQLLRKKERSDEIVRLENLRKIAETFKGKVMHIKAAGKKGKLFGSILAKDIMQELKKEGYDVAEKSIILDASIKKIGEYEIRIILAKEVEVKIKLNVTEV